MTARRPERRERFRLRKRKYSYATAATPARQPALCPLRVTCHGLKMQRLYMICVMCALALAYDPEDPELQRVLPSAGQFEAFYPRAAHGAANGAARAPHGHGSFYKHRNPALVDVKNAAAYGFRFDGVRRFNFDE